MTFFTRRSREMAVIILPVVVLITAAFALAYHFVPPAPPRTITMTTGAEQGAYHAFGRQYVAALAKSGITLQLQPSAGTLENLARLSDRTTQVHVGFVQGGLATSETHTEIASLGRLFLEPLWLFHRADLPLERITGLMGRHVSIGPEGSGTRPLVTKILTASGVTPDNATFLGPKTADAVDMLLAGKADAIFLVSAAESEVIQKLLRAPSVKLFSFNQADALTRLNPYLTKIVLPAGVIDLAANIPSADVTLVAPAATLVVRKDLHPALTGLLVEAAKSIHASSGLFKRANEYPQALDTELPMDEDAARYYKTGASFLQRYLPFGLAVFFERMAVMIIPIATVLLPLFKVVPLAYRWQVRRRILFWYNKLKKLERQIKTDRSAHHFDGYRAEIHRIEEAVSVIAIPLEYTDQLYTLRSAIELVRLRIHGMGAVSTQV
jgi:uncharacterized protein